MIEPDSEFEQFLRTLDSVGEISLIDGGYRVVVHLPEPWPIRIPARQAVIDWLKEKQRDIRVLWHVQRPPYICPSDPEKARPPKPITLDEYPRYVTKPAPDPEFEAFCLSVPDVLGVAIGKEEYIINVNLKSLCPVRRAVYRWMANHGRHFDTEIPGNKRRRAKLIRGTRPGHQHIDLCPQARLRNQIT
ncbi:MAG TPA: hypothetical protein VFB14_18410 [Bryobacteraceae bacterium]|jgi:hypothetical protein|nr:hypothetical protein [Bryobacteraceae bacterium]